MLTNSSTTSGTSPRQCRVQGFATRRHLHGVFKTPKAPAVVLSFLPRSSPSLLLRSSFPPPLPPSPSSFPSSPSSSPLLLLLLPDTCSARDSPAQHGIAKGGRSTWWCGRTSCGRRRERHAGAAAWVEEWFLPYRYRCHPSLPWLKLRPGK